MDDERTPDPINRPEAPDRIPIDPMYYFRGIDTVSSYQGMADRMELPSKKLSGEVFAFIEFKRIQESLFKYPEIFVVVCLDDRSTPPMAGFFYGEGTQRIQIVDKSFWPQLKAALAAVDTNRPNPNLIDGFGELRADLRVRCLDDLIKIVDLWSPTQMSSALMCRQLQYTRSLN